MYYLPVLALLTACNSQPLSPVMEEVVHDYQLWMEDSIDYLHDELNEDPNWPHNIVPIVEQSWKTNYYQTEVSRDPTVAGRAQPALGRVTLITSHQLWEYSLDNYIENREAAEDCVQPHHIDQLSFTVYVLCHENAHMIHIKPHSDVYYIGNVCKYIAFREHLDWAEKCY